MKNLKILIVLIAVIIIGATYGGAQDKSETLIATNTPNISEVKKNIGATWQSIDDPKSVVVYSEDGTYKEIYDNQVLGSGNWELATSLKGTTYENLGDGIYLKQVTSGAPESFFYAVLSIDEKNLVLSYLSRGNTLAYKKIQ